MEESELAFRLRAPPAAAGLAAAACPHGEWTGSCFGKPSESAVSKCCLKSWASLQSIGYLALLGRSPWLAGGLELAVLFRYQSRHDHVPIAEKKRYFPTSGSTDDS